MTCYNCENTDQHYIEIDGELYCTTCAGFCPICGKPILFDGATIDCDGEAICDDCTSEHRTYCDNCGKMVSDTVTGPDGSQYCDECFTDIFVECDECGSIELRDEVHTVSGEYSDRYICDYCRDTCYNVCIECDNLVHEDTSIYIDGDYVCSDCFDTMGYACCGGCGEPHCISAMVAVHEDDDYEAECYCERCASRSRTEIQSYHSHHNPIQYFGDKYAANGLFLGAEIEVDEGTNRSDAAKAMIESFEDNYAYCESDGSLMNGFELITQPATLEHHMSIKENYSTAFKAAIANHFKADGVRSCGLHVHVSKEFFSDNEELYVTRLLYIVEKFWDDLVTFSRRSTSSLERWACKYDDKPEDVVNVWKNRGGYGRYHAVNLQPRHTIEFRMFKGTLNTTAFIATLQLCDTMMRFAKDKEIDEIQRMSFSDLLIYPELKAYWETKDGSDVG